MRQGRLDQLTPSLLDAPEVRTCRVVDVALLRPVDRLYSYLIPTELDGKIEPGMRVIVPFGRGEKTSPAFCLSVSERPWDSTLRTVVELIDERPVLSERLLTLGRWLAQYYAAFLGRTLDLMVPASAKRRAGWKKVRYVALASNPDEAEWSEKDRGILELLKGRSEPLPLDEFKRIAEVSDSVVMRLSKAGRISVEIRNEPVAPVESNVVAHEPNYQLNEDQQAAIARIGEAVEASKFCVEVLFGVTGSGKTEVYVAAARKALAMGRQVIILIPEIALITQTVQRLQTRFAQVAMLHSGMSETQRSRAWTAIAAGQIPVVIGTRSAVFAPCPNLGLIIVDEEAETSYKNQAAPRYHARDVAIQRASLEGIPVVLGSATPSLETWRNVKERKHFNLIRLPRRVNDLPLPKLHLVDMHEEHRLRPGVHMLSQVMESQLSATLTRGEQAVLLLNRRGYAGFLVCARCRETISCPHCSVRMVFHKSDQRAHCHYCHAEMVTPRVCPVLGCNGTLVRFGIGTERVEEEVAKKFPSARVRRMDSDSMKTPAHYAEVLGAFERREFDILVGTQMIAKGLDFPFVSFVGVISADTALAVNDFRAEERTFQLVLQVAGRSGRGTSPGEVVVQTFTKDAAAIQHAVAGDYESFANAELESRKKHGLPPFTRLMRIVLADARMSRVREAANDVAENLRQVLQKCGIRADIHGPLPATITRIRDQYRYDLILTFSTATALMAASEALKAEHALRTTVKNVIVDIDPLSLQ